MSLENGFLKGIIPPLVTPLLGRDELDTEGLEKLVEHILAGGVHGLFVLGTTGEAPGLSYRLRQEIISRTCRQVAGRVPVVVGITDTSFAESANLARFSADSAASAVVLAPPYYFPAGQPELLEYIEHLVPELPLPLVLYNMPSHTKLVFEPDTVRKAMDIPEVIGLKDSSANMVYFHRLQLFLKERPDFTLLVGPEELLGETVLLGGHGGVCGGANLFPRLYVRLYEAAVAGDRTRVEELHELVMQISSTIYSVGHYGSSFLKGIKCALALEGICSDFMAEPFHRFNAPEKARISEYLDKFNPIINSQCC
ncbi:dihydrodipicolinate synthase family protein [Tichowtungia aerotolerans]|uniref:Dihydrodipicolinate synthase family protein n=1 Tax=Tichowtungia aerotolerans TaxID=2697043 RepID=A0A6P1MBG9_9BACT|nr:dihydrodipicolinate synthase family protein [Tichowtungia aerotolerans]QHI69438.1 dihydrodipicolinate synthase family protein [Tichowtungia aerotolerans]